MFKTAVISIAMIIITILGDYFIKKASLLQYFTGWKLLLFGGFLYGLTAIGSFYVYRTTKVFTVGAIHSFGIIIIIIITILLSAMVLRKNKRLRNSGNITWNYFSDYFTQELHPT